MGNDEKAGEKLQIERGTIEHLVKREIPRLLCSMAECVDDDNGEMLIETSFFRDLEYAITDARNQLEAVMVANKTPKALLGEVLWKEHHKQYKSSVSHYEFMVIAKTVLEASRSEPEVQQPVEKSAQKATEIIEFIWSRWYGKYRGDVDTDIMAGILQDAKVRIMEALLQPQSTTLANQSVKVSKPCWRHCDACGQHAPLSSNSKSIF